jgi:hypothetical protein
MLVDCPECGEQISNLAKACPHCGADVERQMGISRGMELLRN